jgi:hypothetical protein
MKRKHNSVDRTCNAIASNGTSFACSDTNRKKHCVQLYYDFNLQYYDGTLSRTIIPCWNIVCIPTYPSDRINILKTNIRQWKNRGFHPILFFNSTNDNILEYLESIDENVYVVYYSSDAPASSGTARCAIYAYCTRILYKINPNMRIAFCDDRRLIKFSLVDKYNPEYDKMMVNVIYKEMIDNNILISWAQSQQKNLFNMPHTRKSTLKKLHINASLDIARRGQCFFTIAKHMHSIWELLLLNNIEGIASPLGGDYYLSSILHPGSEVITPYCARYTNEHHESKARPKLPEKDMIEEIQTVLRNPISYRRAKLAFIAILQDDLIGTKIRQNLDGFQSHYAYASILQLI